MRRQREDHGIARPANAILLLADGESCAQIAKFLHLDDDTIRGWYKVYRRDGWEVLAIDGWQGGRSRMSAAREAALCPWPESRFCRSTAGIGAHIPAEFGLGYSHSGCIRLLARLGFEYRKPKPLPQVASAERQADVIALYERLPSSLAADEAVYLADAVHPECQTEPAFGWVKAGSNPAVKTTAGRGRVNIHGALNLETFDLETFDAPFAGPRWHRRRTASGRDQGPQPRQARDPRHPGQGGLPQEAGCQDVPVTTRLPHPPDPTAPLLPAPEPDRAALGGHAPARDA